MAERLQPAAAELVELAAVNARDAVLDIACGTGNAALMAARRAERVVGVDSEPRLLEIAAMRGRSAGVAVDWVCADALSPELPERAFSGVLSAFGLMYVPDQSAAAAALARASAPGARIALASWTPGSFMPLMGGMLSSYLPSPPPGSAPPSRWGDEAAVTELLRAHAIEVRVMRRSSLRLSFADCTEAREFLIRTAGNILAERSNLERAGRWRDLEHDLENLVRDQNENSRQAVELDCEYLLVLAAASVE
ncbi:MAG TPA: class I SAM-dependent methyltransferase [Solirubrobacteraceae bacterium]|jgi:SAM-dependent methyltransferase